MGPLLQQGIIAAIGALLLLYRPSWGVLILLAMWFSKISPRLLGIGVLSVPNLVAALLLLVLVLSMLQERKIWVLKVPQVKILLAIGLLFLVSTWWSDIKYPVVYFPELDLTRKTIQIFFTRLLF